MTKTQKLNALRNACRFFGYSHGYKKDCVIYDNYSQDSQNNWDGSFDGNLNETAKYVGDEQWVDIYIYNVFTDELEDNVIVQFRGNDKLPYAWVTYPSERQVPATVAI